MPRTDTYISAAIKPTMARPTASRTPTMTEGSAPGSMALTMTWDLLAPNARQARIQDSWTWVMPVMVLMTIGMTAARNTMMAFDRVPTQTTTIGTKAMIGEVLSATIRGSNK